MFGLGLTGYMGTSGKQRFTRDQGKFVGMVEAVSKVRELEPYVQNVLEVAGIRYCTFEFESFPSPVSTPSSIILPLNIFRKSKYKKSLII